MTQYFSDREFGEQPRTAYEISPTVWEYIAWLVQERIDNGSFGQRFPEKCGDFDQIVCYGVNIPQFEVAIKGEIPALAKMEQDWKDSESDPMLGYRFSHSKRISQMSQVEQPPLTVVMDIIEFCWASVGKPEEYYYHSFFQHNHLRFDKSAGQSEFRDAVNLIFQRNELAFNLTEHGRVERLIPGPVGGALRGVLFQTGDTELDQLLETARCKILVPDENEHRDALEKLWDAWERLKTIEHSDKAKGAAIMLDKAAGTSQPALRSLLEAEAKALTDAGNKLRIRHSETTQERLEAPEQVDYLFQRMYSLLHFVLNATGHLG